MRADMGWSGFLLVGMLQGEVMVTVVVMIVSCSRRTGDGKKRGRALIASLPDAPPLK